MQQQTEGHWTITPEAMLNMVNEKRREHSHTPIDHTAMTTRLVLRSQVACPGIFDFRAAEIVLDSETMPVLEELLNEQFDLSLRSELRRRCTFRPPKTATRAPERKIPVTVAADASQGESLLGRLKRLFGLGKSKPAG